MPAVFVICKEPESATFCHFCSHFPVTVDPFSRQKWYPCWRIVLIDNSLFCRSDSPPPPPLYLRIPFKWSPRQNKTKKLRKSSKSDLKVEQKWSEKRYSAAVAKVNQSGSVFQLSSCPLHHNRVHPTGGVCFHVLTWSVPWLSKSPKIFKIRFCSKARIYQT